MFKWFGWCLLFVLLLLVGCDPITPPVVVEKPAQEGTYYFLAANNADPFYIPGVAGFTDAGKAVGMKTAFVGPMDLNVNAQLNTFEELVASPETKGIFWYPSDFVAGEPIIKEAVEKGIPIVIGAADSPYKTRDAFIGVDDYVFGTQAGAWAQELTDCEGKVGTMALIQPNTDTRIKAFTEYLTEMCPDMTFAERVSHDGSIQSAAVNLDAYVIAHPDMVLIYFADGGGGQQAQNWKEKQAQGLETMFLATDSPPMTLQAIKDGIFVGTVAQDTYTEEYWGVLLLDALHKGLNVPDTLYLSSIRIDVDNVDEYLEE